MDDVSGFPRGDFGAGRARRRFRLTPPTSAPRDPGVDFVIPRIMPTCPPRSMTSLFHPPRSRRGVDGRGATVLHHTAPVTLRDRCGARVLGERWTRPGAGERIRGGGISESLRAGRESCDWRREIPSRALLGSTVVGLELSDQGLYLTFQVKFRMLKSMRLNGRGGGFARPSGRESVQFGVGCREWVIGFMAKETRPC